MFHPHLHCVIPGGGLSPDGDRWVSCRPRFFLSVHVLSRLFRRLFLELLQQAFDAGQLHFFTSLLQLHDPAAFAAYLDPLRQAEWVVYAKAPFAGPQQISTTSDATLIASPFPTIVFWTSKMVRCNSATRTIATAASRR